MYIDGVIVFSLVAVLLVLVMMAYVFRYAYRHILKDMKQSAQRQHKAAASTQ